MDILSPVWGQVSAPITGLAVQIYIPVKEIHTVHAPISGVVAAINAEEGMLTTEHGRTVFEVPEPKVGKAWIRVDDVEKDLSVAFWLEVGKPQYVTNKVRLDVKTGDRVTAGQEIGEIILGSLAMVHLPSGSVPLVSYDPIAHKGTALAGGITPIAYVPVQSIVDLI